MTFDDFPLLCSYIQEMESTGYVPEDWSGFLTEINGVIDAAFVAGMQVGAETPSQ